MKKVDKPLDPKEAIAIFNTLGDYDRLKIIYLMFFFNGVTIADLERVLRINKVKIYRHLKLMVNNGIIYEVSVGKKYKYFGLTQEYMLKIVYTISGIYDMEIIQNLLEYFRKLKGGFLTIIKIQHLLNDDFDIRLRMIKKTSEKEFLDGITEFMKKQVT